MRAIVVAENGGPEVLNLAEIDAPEPGPGEVAIKIEASGVNFIDVYFRIGLYPAEKPFVPGSEGAGTVVALGEGVTEVAVGDRVATVMALGTYGEVMISPIKRVIKVPDGLSTDLAAASLLQGTTAHYLVNDTYKLQSGDTCLIHAGAGGVGLLLTQMAKQKGATVITTVGTPEKAELSLGAGADKVIQYTKDDFVEEIAASHGMGSLAVIYDGVGKATLEPGLPLLKPRGLMAAFGNASGPPEPLNLLKLSGGSWFVTRPGLGHYLLTRDELLERAGAVYAQIVNGTLDVRIGARYPLSDVAEAHRALEGRKTTGKVLIDL